MYEVRLCPVQKNSTRYKSTFSLLHDGRLESRKAERCSFCVPCRCRTWDQENAIFTDKTHLWNQARGTGEGGRKRDITAAGRVWQQQGEHDLVDHVLRYRMVRFGGYPTQVEGAGRDTVKIILHGTQELTIYKVPLPNGTHSCRFPDSI